MEEKMKKQILCSRIENSITKCVSDLHEHIALLKDEEVLEIVNQTICSLKKSLTSILLLEQKK